MMAMRSRSDWHGKPPGWGMYEATCTGGWREQARGAKPMRLVDGQLFAVQPTFSSLQHAQECGQESRPLMAVLDEYAGATVSRFDVMLATIFGVDAGSAAQGVS